MGVIQRQGFKYSIVNFIGMGIGILSTLFIYPNALEIVGLFRALVDASVLATIIVLLGSPTSAVRFFPRYMDDETGNKGLLSWLLIVYTGGFLLFLLFFPWINDLMIKYLFRERNAMFADFIIYIIPLTFCIGLINLLGKYISNFRRIVIPAAIENLSIKIALPVIIFIYLGGYINVEGVIILIVVAYILATVGMTIYLSSLGQTKLTKPAILDDRASLKEYSVFSGYSLLAGIGGQVAFRIDTLMVTSMLQLKDTGIFVIGATISEVISKPMRALNAISAPMISHYIETGNMEEVKSLYKKSSLNMTIIGLGMFLLIWNILPSIFELMPNSETMRAGSYVVFFLGLAQLCDMTTGINSEIITFSKHYKFNLYLTLLLGVANITTNFWLIPEYGMTGAAMATCLSFFLFNLAKFLFIYFRFGFQPFSPKLIPVLGFGIGAWFICRWLPSLSNPLFDIVYKGTLFCFLYGLSIWGFKISPDINQWLANSGQKLIRIFHRPT